MISGRIGYEFAGVGILAVLCVLLVFLFPSERGPYTAVHGPVTAFQAARAGARVQGAIVQAALDSSRSYPVLVPIVVFWTAVPTSEFQPVSLAERGTILRC